PVSTSDPATGRTTVTFPDGRTGFYGPDGQLDSYNGPPESPPPASVPPTNVPVAAGDDGWGARGPGEFVDVTGHEAPATVATPPPPPAPPAAPSTPAPPPAPSGNVWTDQGAP